MANIFQKLGSKVKSLAQSVKKGASKVINGVVQCVSGNVLGGVQECISGVSDIAQDYINNESKQTSTSASKSTVTTTVRVEKDKPIIETVYYGGGSSSATSRGLPKNSYNDNTDVLLSSGKK